MDLGFWQYLDELKGKLQQLNTPQADPFSENSYNRFGSQFVNRDPHTISDAVPQQEYIAGQRLQNSPAESDHPMWKGTGNWDVGTGMTQDKMPNPAPQVPLYGNNQAFKFR